MSTKCQTRWSNNYNCFKQCCLYVCAFLSLYLCDCEWAARVQQPELGLMNEMGTKCFDILSMFHGCFLRVLLQYSSPLLILISHNGADFCACEVTRVCVCLCCWKRTHTSHIPQTCLSTIHLVTKANRVCVCEMCNVFISVYPPPLGALKLNIFFFPS